MDWEFSDALEFLKAARSDRRTFSTNTASETVGLESSAETTETSNYSYATTRKTNKEQVGNSVSGLTESITKLIQSKTKQIQEKEGIKHIIMLANLDRMLQKLPDRKVEDLYIKYVSMAYDEIQKLEADAE